MGVYTNILKQALSNQSVHDFVIVEYNGEIGGRVAHTQFGKTADNGSYTVELGANWVGTLSRLLRREKKLM